MVGHGQLLQLEDLTEEQIKSVDHILRAGRHLLGLINEVLDLARIESGHLALSPEAVDVYEVLNDTIDLIGPLAAERALRIHSPSPPGCTWTVQDDRQRLQQVLLSLTSNAVTDTGLGIPADKLPRLFTQFDRRGPGNHLHARALPSHGARLTTSALDTDPTQG